MFYQQSFNHNLVSFRRAHQYYCQPWKKGTFLLKRALFLIILKVGGGGTCPQCLPPSYALLFKDLFSLLSCSSSDFSAEISLLVLSFVGTFYYVHTVLQFSFVLHFFHFYCCVFVDLKASWKLAMHPILFYHEENVNSKLCGFLTVVLKFPITNST